MTKFSGSVIIRDSGCKYEEHADRGYWFRILGAETGSQFQRTSKCRFGMIAETADRLGIAVIEYIEKQSFWLDIMILLQTPLAVVTGKGAG